VSLDLARAAARDGTLYPAVILYGGDAAARREAAVDLARTLLCVEAGGRRPCGECRHCRRIVWSDEESEGAFHPDFRILARDLKTATSVEAARSIALAAQLAPFEARGQVFVVAAAETLTPEAANALLKVLEEPPVRAPRHFLLLAPSRLDLLPTLRSRALSVFLGGARVEDPEAIERVAERFAATTSRFLSSGHPIHALRAAAVLGTVGDFSDPRAGLPWALAAAAVRAAVMRPALGEDAPAGRRARRALLDLAADLLEAAPERARGITAERLLEGLVARRLAGARVVP
jgi:hypothetical protein